MKKAITALSTLQLAYSTDLTEERLEFYAAKLIDVNHVTLAQAVSNLIDRCRFLPTIAEIKEECNALSNYVNARDELPTAQEAWERVIKSAQTYGFEHGLDHLDGLTLTAARAIWSSFNPTRGNDYNESSCRAQFIKNYEQQEQREKHRQRMANSIKDNHLLLQARKKAEQERTLIETGHKRIEMTATGNLVEVAQKPVDLDEIVNSTSLSDKAKDILRSALSVGVNE